MKPHETPEGVKYLIRHERPRSPGGLVYFPNGDVLMTEDAPVSQKGGRTVVTIVDDAGEPILRERRYTRADKTTEVIVSDAGQPIFDLIVGEAHCHPNENFNKKLGATIALGRALKTLRAG